MSDVRPVTAGDIDSASGLVDLSLSPTDAAEVAELLSAWMPAAIALSTRMQDVQDLAPISTFTTLSGLRSEEIS